jgi:hypothetical protein
MNRLLLLLVCVALFVPACATAPAQRAAVAGAPAERGQVEELVARHIAWRGGAAFERLRSVYLEADITVDGMTGITREWRERSGRTRDELELPVTKAVEVRTAIQGWNKIDALTSPLGPFEIEDGRREILVEFGDALRGGSGASAKRLPDEELDGRRWAVLRVTFGDSDSYDMFLDPATGAQHGRRYTRDSRPIFVRLSDWRMVEGVRFPFFREAYRSNGKFDASVKVRSIDANPQFADALFAPPASERTLSFTRGLKSTGPIKYNPFTGARIYIPAKVNGREVEVLLDSGADSTVLDRTFAESIGRTAIGSAVATGSGGEMEAGYAKGVEISIGSMTLQLPTVGVIDLAEVSNRIAIPLPVILGKDVFLQSIVDIDPSKETIEFHHPSNFTPPAGAALVPLLPVGSLRVVPVSVEGLPEAPMIFDLGNGGYMSLTPAYWQKHDLLAGRRSSTRSSGAIGGEQINQVATLKTVRFAGVTFRNVPAQFNSPNIETDSDREAGNVGMPLLRRFRMMIDFQNSRMFVVPVTGALAEPFDRDRSGLRAVQEGTKLVVRHVSKGSPAEAAGWKVGDTIVAIDGRKIGPEFPSSRLSLWATRPAGTVVKLTMADGSTRNLTLGDYF